MEKTTAPTPPPSLAPPAQRRTYNVAEVAAMLGISKWTLYRTVKRQEVEHLKFGSRVVIPRREVERLLGEPVGVPGEGESG